ncbi:MAG TPA: chloride channel protein [Chitinophaga sp.]|uniref:chloride channel protein n=1 Tax=Chitinophaga sp. TaxID=1869181 RepID=UPI002B86EA1D|nr:chloride channel protein [Chitinophaga sp.]HVI48884.1 chloride channel protein [Chitinophaga sp.]
MQNFFHRFNRNGLLLSPIPQQDNNGPEIAPALDLTRMPYLIVLAVLVSATGIMLATGIMWLINVITQLSFFGNPGPGTDIPADTELGKAILLIPVVGAVVAIFLQWRNNPLLKVLGLTAIIGTGAPLGEEGPVMLIPGALAVQMQKQLKINAAELNILSITGIAAGLSWYFGVPVAALCLVLEVLLIQWSFASILPVLAGVVTGAALHYFFQGTEPAFILGNGPAVSAKALLVYTAIGLLIGLFSALIIGLMKRLNRLFDQLLQQSRWWMLSGAILTGLLACSTPEILGTGNKYINDLLQAHVTLQLLFALSLMKLLSWMIVTSSAKTGTTVMPLLLIGGALGLLLAVIFQVAWPSAIINPGMAALIGMAAMLAGVSRALITTVIFAVETTHQPETILPLICATVAAYSVSFFLVKKRVDGQLKVEI